MKLSDELKRYQYQRPDDITMQKLIDMALKLEGEPKVKWVKPKKKKHFSND